MTKLRAFSTHLLASLVIVSIFLCIMFFSWYPSPYFEVDGGWTVLRILLGVDLVLGPLLTLILFKPGKKGLKFDMTCIVLMQLGALIYGGTIIYQQRPEFVVFAVDRFTTVAASAVEPDKLKYSELKQISVQGPKFAIATIPEDAKRREEIMFQTFAGGKDIEQMPELYEPYKPDLEQLRKRNIDLAAIMSRSEDAKKAVEQFINEQGRELEDYLYLPLMGKNKDVVMVLSNEDGTPVSTISINPWLSDYPDPDEQTAKS